MLNIGENGMTDNELKKVNGGAGVKKPPTKKGTCPHCKQQTLVVKYKRLECSNCGYVEKM